jgi:Condensation domain/TubC N-terminal docking domain
MPDANELLSSLYQRGVKVWVDNEQLRLQAPTGTLLPDELHKVRALKGAVIELLKQTAFDLQPRPSDCAVPLTPMQVFSWNCSGQGKVSERACSLMLRVQGSLNRRSLERSLEAVIERHESLRTRIVCVDGVPTQQIDKAGEYHLEEIDLSGISAATVEAEALRIAEEFVQEKVDLSVGPLFAAKLLRRSDDEFRLILAMDHVIADAVSTEILNKEIWAHYAQAEQGSSLSLPKPSVQFADYAVWQQQTRGVWWKQHEAYWKRRLAGAAYIPMVSNDRLPKAERPVGALSHFSFGAALSAKLRDVARREQTQLAIVVFCIFTVVMSRWFNQKDLVIRFLISGRHHPKLENMIGFLAQFLHLRMEVADKIHWLDLLRQATLEFRSAYEHHDFGRLPELMPEWAWRLDGIDLRFQWAPSSTASWPNQSAFGDKLSVQPLPLVILKPIDFLPYFYDSPGGVGCYVMYRPDIFAPCTVERFGRHLQTCGQELVERC